MDYRDERDALRARAESLEGAVATAQAELTRMQATEAALDAAKREIWRLRAEVERLRPKQRPAQNRSLAAIIGVGLVVMAAAFGAALTLRANSVSPTPSPYDTPGQVTEVPAPKQPDPPPKQAEPPPVPPPARPAETRTASAQWNATVAKSQGDGPPPGTACKILADLTGDGQSVDVRDVEVLCGAKYLYRSTDRFSGMANRDSSADEQAGKTAGTSTFAIMFQDQGTRSGRAQISLDTTQKSGAVWSDNVPTFRVELRVEPSSLEREGEPLILPENRRERITDSVVRTGTVKRADGTPPASPGAPCTVDVSPAQNGDSNCRVRVRCGGKLLYGEDESGYTKCTTQGGRVSRAADPRKTGEDGDPALDMDLPENTVVVSDDGDASWKVTIALTPVPR